MIKLTTFALPLITIVGCGVQQVTASPNIVILFVDDLGWADLGYQNTKFDTPNIDKLKNDGVYFQRTYITTATSSPSRAALITGKESLRCGFVRHIYHTQSHLPYDQRSEFQTLDKDPGNMLSRAWLPLEEETYAERLKDFDYHNIFIGKWHLGHEPYYPDKQGFDEMFAVTEYGHPSNYYNVPFFKKSNIFANLSKDEYLTEVLTDGAVDFIEEYDSETPFLLNMWYYTVHSPHRGRKDYVNEYTLQGMEQKDAHYAAMIRSLDDSIGRIISALKDAGKSDDTMIIFMSDQGGGFENGGLRGGKKGGDAIAEGGSRVPMIIYHPKMKAMGTTYQEPVSSIDIFPTIIEAASGKPCSDKQLNGVSLMPILRGKSIANRDIFLFRSYEDQNSAIINGDWKLIKYRSGKLELYNLSNDIGETANLSMTHTKIRDEMLRRLLKWEKEATPQYLIQNKNK